jgi:hypothetical protein
MISIIDRAALKRKASLAQIFGLGGLAILLVGVVMPFVLPNQTTLPLILLIGGFAVAAVGIYLANRWVKRPRPEETLDKTLKSLSDQFRIYHYQTPWDHLLLAPTGLVILDVINLDGVFSYEKGRWNQKMTISRAFRYFFDEQLGDPVKRVQAAVSGLNARLEKELPGCGPIPVIGVAVFIHPLAVVNAKDTPIPICIPKTLQKRIPVQGTRLKPEVYTRVQEFLDAGGASA